MSASVGEGFTGCNSFHSYKSIDALSIYSLISFESTIFLFYLSILLFGRCCPDMIREDIEFKTSDAVTLRGWLYRPNQDAAVKLPCLILSHGYTALKEMDLDAFSQYFVSKISIACLVYDNRGFGTSEQRADEPRHEIIAAKQVADMSDAITYAQGRDDINAEKIGVWGSSYSAGHVLVVAAIDKRVKAVISQVPMVDGWTLLNRLVRADLMVEVEKLFVAGMAVRQNNQFPIPQNLIK